MKTMMGTMLVSLLQLCAIILKCCNLISAVDGGWSAWGAWSHLPETCGYSATVFRQRTCTSPAPSFGGHGCQDEAIEAKNVTCKPCRKSTYKTCPHYRILLINMLFSFP